MSTRIRALFYVTEIFRDLTLLLEESTQSNMAFRHWLRSSLVVRRRISWSADRISEVRANNQEPIFLMPGNPKLRRGSLPDNLGLTVLIFICQEEPLARPLKKAFPQQPSRETQVQKCPTRLSRASPMPRRPNLHSSTHHSQHISCRLYWLERLLDQQFCHRA